MKTRAIIAGIAIIFCAILLLFLPATGIPVWKAIVGTLFLAWAIIDPVDMFIPVAIIFFLFEAPIAYAMGIESGNLVSNWIVIVAAILATVGMNFIIRSKWCD